MNIRDAILNNTITDKKTFNLISICVTLYMNWNKEMILAKFRTLQIYNATYRTSTYLVGLPNDGWAILKPVPTDHNYNCRGICN